MFPLLDDRDVPQVEEKIISYLRPKDLFNAKLVCKKWDGLMKKRIKYLKVTNDMITRIQLWEDTYEVATTELIKLRFVDFVAKSLTYVTTGKFAWPVWITGQLIKFVESDFKLCGRYDRYESHLNWSCLCLVNKRTEEVLCSIFTYLKTPSSRIYYQFLLQEGVL